MQSTRNWINFWFLGLSLAWAAATPAQARIDPDTIQYKQWPNGKPSVMVVRANRCDAGSSFASRAIFSWADAAGGTVESMEQIGTALLQRNGYNTDPKHKTGFLPATPFYVMELALGAPDAVRKQIPIGNEAASFRQADMDAIPYGAKKALLLRLRAKSHIDNYTTMHILAVAFDEISDEDLRRIAFEEGVTRQFCWRK